MTLSIRRATLADAGALTRHLNEPAVYGGTLQLPFAADALWEKRLAEGLVATGPDRLMIAERNGEFAGHASLHAVSTSPRRQHALMLGIGVVGNAQGQGVGTALMTTLCEYADRWVGTLRLELTVFADNAVAIRLYRNFGFEIEGTLRAYALRDGRYADAHMMARLHPSPPVLGHR